MIILQNNTVYFLNIGLYKVRSLSNQFTRVSDTALFPSSVNILTLAPKLTSCMQNTIAKCNKRKSRFARGFGYLLFISC